MANNLTIGRVGKVWRAQYNGVTICSCYTKSATKANADYLMNHMQREVWQALVKASELEAGR
jgi:hypothetical protein